MFVSEYNFNFHHFQIEYEDSYEPYLVMKRKQIPDFDERFLGRYKNKVSHRFEIAAIG